MPKLDTAHRQLAYALATAQRGPDSSDPTKIEKIAGAIGRMTPGQREHFLEHAENIRRSSGGIMELNSYGTAIKHMIHSEDLRKDPRAPELWINENDILNGIRYFLVMDRVSKSQAKELSAAASTGDLSTFQKLLQDAGLASHLDTAPLAVRLLKNLPDRITAAKKDGATVVDPSQAEGSATVRVRQSTVEEAQQVHAELMDTIETLQGMSPATAQATRDKAADLAARLLTLSTLLPKSSKLRDQLAVPFWRAVTETLSDLGVPGFVTNTGSLQVDLPGLDLKLEARTRMSLNVTVMAPALQLGPRGADPNLYRPGEEEPAIRLAQDERYLGNEGSPLGFVSPDGKHVVVPQTYDTGIVEQRRIPGGYQDMPLSLDEIPRQGFYFHTRYWGTLLALPIRISIGSVQAELKNGRYQADGVEITTKRIGEDQIEISASGQSKPVVLPLVATAIKSKGASNG